MNQNYTDLAGKPADESTQRLLNLYNRVRVSAPNVSAMKLDAIDKLYDSEGDTEFRMPLVRSQIESAIADAASAYLTKPEIFPLAGPPETDDIRIATQLVWKKYAKQFRWADNLAAILSDFYLYPVCAAEVSWAKVTVPAMKRGTQTVKAGVAIKHVPVRELIYDHSLLPDDVQRMGLFVGKIQRMSKTAAFQYLRSELPGDDKTLTHIEKAIELDKEENIDVPGETSNQFMADWDGTTVEGFAFRHQVTVATVYVRIRAVDFKLKSTAPRELQVWRLIVLNHRQLMLAEPMADNTGEFPIIVAALERRKTLAEQLADMQRLASTLATSDIKSARRAVGDRIAYNRRLLPEGIPQDTNHIPVNQTGLGDFSINQAVLPIPYQDPALGARVSQALQLVQTSGMLTGQNQAAQGQFVRGNKSATEFTQTMQGANARQVLRMIRVDDRAIAPIKERVLLLTALNQTELTAFDPNTRKSVTFPAGALATASVEFDVDDGFGFDGSDELYVQALQFMMGSPDLALEYDIPGMFTSLMGRRGAYFLSRYKLSEDQKNAKLQLLAAKQQAENPAPPNAGPAQGA